MENIMCLKKSHANLTNLDILIRKLSLLNVLDVQQ